MQKAVAQKVETVTLKEAGLRLGSVDLRNFGQIMDNDPGKRKEVIAANVAFVKEARHGNAL